MLPGWTVRNALRTRESWLAAGETASVTVCSGLRYRPEATSPNCRSRSTITTLMGATLPRPMAMLVAMVVLPTPPLGEKTPIDQSLGAFGLAGRRRSGSGWRRTGRPAPAAPGSGPDPTAGLRMSRMPARMACRTKAGSGVADQDDAELRQLDVEDRGEPQGVLHRDVRPQDEDLGPLLVEVGEQFAGVRRADEREGLQRRPEARRPRPGGRGCRSRRSG